MGVSTTVVENTITDPNLDPAHDAWFLKDVEQGLTEADAPAEFGFQTQKLPRTASCIARSGANKHRTSPLITVPQR